MNEEELKRLKALRQVYEYSEWNCDPLDYFQRKKDLLHAVVKTLLQPLHEFEENNKGMEQND